MTASNDGQPAPGGATPPDELRFRVALHRVPRLGSKRFALLEAGLPGLEAAWRADRGTLMAAGLDAATASAVVQARAELDPDAELERLHRAGVRPVAPSDPAYPTRLHEIADAPPLLYMRGSWEPEDEWSVAVVGTRRATAYGRQAGGELARGLAASRVTVVSGLARGIDTVAHRATLDAGGRTVAVLANGLDSVYPPENRRLAAEVMERGALLSDYPLGTQPRAAYFPRRNRIMSGVALGTLVIEADVKSGAMITARLAMEQDREVFAVPGSIFSPQSRGPLGLLRDGATPVTRAEDVLEALHLTTIGAQLDFGRAVPAQTDEERAVMATLSRDPRHVDELVRECGLAAATVAGTLALLELKGLVRDLGAMQYVRIREDPAEYTVGEAED